MPEAAKPAFSDTQLKECAFELFRMGANISASPKQRAIVAFKNAKAFLETTAEIMSGEIDPFFEDTDPLDAAFCPNLKKTHPCNLMSRHWGSLDKVEEVMKVLQANPGQSVYEPYGWDYPEVNKARALFPAVLEKAKLAKQAAKN